MARTWTEAQSAAINTRNKTLLVSAAAGSGKTAALTERIIRSLTDKDSPADISNMLIVTFTRAAAAELRQRIFTSLSEALAEDPDNKHLCNQLINISSAKICTIDAFYLDVIRTNFDKLSISPSFRTADASELDVLARSVMEDAVDDFYENRCEDFSMIAECFVGLRSSSRLAEIFLDLYSRTSSLPEGIEFIKASSLLCEKEATKDFFKTSFGNIIQKNLLDECEYYLSALSEYCYMMADDEHIGSAYLSAFAYDKGYVEKLCTLLCEGSYEDCRAHIMSYTPLKLGSLKKEFKNDFTDECTGIRNKLKERIKAWKEKTFAHTPQSIFKLMYKTAHISEALYDLLYDFDRRFSSEKKQRNIFSFTDIRRLAMELLVNKDGAPTPTALEYAERYTDIYIDEYQDVDRVQDLIFRAISKPTARFMVGDIKQSIYSFRGAEPQVFSEYRKLFPDITADEDSQAASIFMSNNFRCDSTVIDFTNTVCSFVFSECGESMGYTKADDLVFSKIVENRKTDEAPVEVAILVDGEKNEEDTDEEAKKEDSKTLEARYIALRISELLKDGKKADGTKILPHDIAVLFRTKAMGAYVKKALNEVGILSSDNTDENYFENPDVLLILCLLNAIDNPQRDIYLAGLLRSPIFNFTLDELVEIKYAADKTLSIYDALCLYKEGDSALAHKCRTFDNILSEYRDLSASLSVDKLLRHIYSSNLIAATGLVNSNDDNNLIRLYEYARKFESGSFKGLYNFIVYINKIIEEGTKIESASGEATEGRVTLMTIHQSKGLEFPVCFLCNAGGGFNMQESRESLAFEPSVGLAMKIADSSGLARINTPMREAMLSVAERKQTEEEMRILYVALTRARERLIVSATSRRSSDDLIKDAIHDHKFKNRFTVCASHSYIEWILASLAPTFDTSFCKIEWIDKNAISKTSFATEEEVVSKEEIEIDSEIQKMLNERFSYVYPYEAASRLPAKISVSEILGDPHKNGDDGTTYLFENKKSYTAPPIFSGRSKDGTLSARRGTATHLFMQFCDFDNAEKNGIESELYRLIEKKFVPKDTNKLVYLDELEKFFESELYGEIKSAKRIIREQRFNILLPPTLLNSDPEFAEQTKEEFLAVQGVIDLIIEDKDGNIILCDYKTDRLTKSELESYDLLAKKMTDRHKKQLSFYKDAISTLFSKDCKKILIYSTQAARSVEIE